MLFRIENGKTELICSDGAYVLGAWQDALGNIIAALESSFPELSQLTSEEYRETVIDRIGGNLSGDSTLNQAVNIWGMDISADIAWNLIHIETDLDKSEKGGIILSLQFVENWRVRHFVSVDMQPLSLVNVDYSKGVNIWNVQSLYDIVYGLLYVYAFNGLKLVKCRHCEKWFATDTLKAQFCTRKSPVARYTHLACEQAVRNIRQQCTRQRNRIVTKARSTNAHNHFEDDFIREDEPLQERQQKFPTAANLSEYMQFLRNTEKGRAWLKRETLK